MSCQTPQACQALPAPDLQAKGHLHEAAHAPGLPNTAHSPGTASSVASVPLALNSVLGDGQVPTALQTGRYSAGQCRRIPLGFKYACSACPPAHRPAGMNCLPPRSGLCCPNLLSCCLLHVGMLKQALCSTMILPPSARATVAVLLGEVERPESGEVAQP